MVWASGNHVGDFAEFLHEHTRAVGETVNGAPIFVGYDTGHCLYRKRFTGRWCFAYSKEEMRN